MVPTVEAHVQEHPLRAARTELRVPAGETIAGIIARAELKQEYGIPTVIIKRGLDASVVPVDLWGKVRPKPGTQVLVHYEVEAGAGAILASLISAAAPTIAGSVFGLTAGTFGFALATAAITVVGGLLVNALIPPAAQPGVGSQDPAQQTITGTQNRSNPYGTIPKPLGRIRCFPVKGAQGYTVTTDEGEIEFRGRYIIGWGPLCISDLRIGTTAIQDFDDVEIEFLNVDETETLARQPALSSLTKAWRTGDQQLTLYPSDVAEDGYSVELEQSTAIVRRTRTGSESADVDITFPAGLFRQRQTVNERDTLTAAFSFRYREVGAPSWTDAGTLSVTSKQNSQFRKTHKITFPAPGEYDIEVTQTSENVDQSNYFDTAVLSAIRSFRPGTLPSHDGVAEIAIRVRATDQLNGQIDTLNCRAHQMCRKWNGSTWTAPVVTRHPAWILADWLQGAHIRRAVPDMSIDLTELKAWADQEPHWTCDFMVESKVSIREIADIICPTGRAKFSLTDLKYSVIREKPSSPIRQLVTPRNTWGFKGSIIFPKEIHAMRCIVRSERQDWAEDEVIVYADGYDASNATAFEELRLPGVVLTEDDTDQSNVYKLARYHLAVTLLRFEQMTFQMDFEHLQVQRGDPVLVVHDVPSIGPPTGSARIKSINRNGSALVAITLDDDVPNATGQHRIVVRTRTGTPVEFQANAPVSASSRRWSYVSGSVDATVLNEDDLVVIQETSEGKFEALVTNIRRSPRDNAVVTVVPRAVGVTLAADGEIPDYTPVVTIPQSDVPAAPVVRSVASDQTTAITNLDGQAQPRILVRLQGRREVRETAVSVQVRWRAVGEQTFQVSQRFPVGTLSLYTLALEDGVAYQVDVSSINASERRSEWVPATASLVATTSASKTPKAPGSVITESHFQLIKVVWEAVTEYTDDTFLVGAAEYNVYRSDTSSQASAELIATTSELSHDDVGIGTLSQRWYWVTAVDIAGNESAFAGPATGQARQITATDIGDAIIDYDDFAPDVVTLFTDIANDIGQLTDDTVELEADVTALQTDFTSLDGSVSANSSAISGLETRVTNAEGSITSSASQITSLQSDLSDVEGDVSGQATAISGLDTRVTNAEGQVSAVSSSLSSLSTTVGNNTASVTQAAQSINGIEAKYTVEVDANGVAGGFQLIGGGGGTAFNIRADQLALFPPSGGSGGTQVFTVFTTDRTIGGKFYPAGVYIEQAYIDAARVVALDADSISVSNLAEFTGFLSASSGARSVLIDPGGSFEVFEAIGSGSQNVARIVKTSSTSSGTALEVRQEGSSASGIFIDKVGGGSGDALLIETNGGSASTGADIRNVSSGGGEAQIALSSANGGYAFFAVDGDYLVSAGHSYATFTGSHHGMIDKTLTVEPGDILVDVAPISVSLSDAFFEVGPSTRIRQPNVIGVYVRDMSWGSPTQTFPEHEATHDKVVINALGEGAINVCGEGGNIRAGDLIMTSAMPGKGRKQGGNIVKSYSVARAREAATFDTPNQVKQIACIYLCG